MKLDEKQILDIQNKLTESKVLVDALGKSRELSLVITKIDEAVLWLTAAIMLEAK